MISCSELGLFGTDVVTDWLNGSNLILDGHVRWGWVMVLLPFLPGAVVGVFIAWGFFREKRYGMCSLTLLFYVPGVLLGTPLYMAFVIFSSCVKLFKPDLDDKEKVLCGLVGGNVVKTGGPLLRMSEIVGESYPQSMLGEFPLNQACFA